ncbi:MAG: choice-of-anchor D domain-containing protein [Chlorobi bacterium]|nr:choice-of-anchor D domain-containing protein [Chlorobiota bacterium]
MKRITLLFLALLIGSVMHVWADYRYEFTYGTATPTDMTGSDTALGANVDEGRAVSFDIGFTFNFYADDESYETFSVSSNGWMKLGSAPFSSDWSNGFDAFAQYPIIAPFWDDLRTYPDSGYVRYKTEGSEGSRVLTVEWRTRYWSSSAAASGPWVFQARLYEGTDAIEFVYVSMPGNYNTSATIGIATSGSNHTSVILEENVPPTVSSTEQDNSINIDSSRTPISDNTVYVFYPCEEELTTIAGDLSQGGTENMEEGDVLLEDKELARGDSETFNPFSISIPENGCNSVIYTATFSGPAAGDYSVPPRVVKPGRTVSPDIIFTPQAIGARDATMDLNFFSAVNIALNATATASSGTTAARAIDGNTSGAGADNSIAETNSEEEPWIEVDVGSVYPIRHITLYNRDGFRERLDDYHVFVSEDPFGGGTTIAELQADTGVWEYSDSNAPDPIHDFTVNRSGRYVRLMVDNNDSADRMHVAEIEVYAASGDNEVITYGVNATGLPRIDWIGNIAQGGTADMNSGDVLMSNIEVNRGDTGTSMPFSIGNNGNPLSSPAEITYRLDDPLGLYDITVPGAEKTSTGTTTVVDSVAGGSASTPRITFSPDRTGTEFGIGPQEATLRITADGETRVFTLRGFGVGVAAEFFVEGESMLDNDRRYYRNIVTCVGEYATTLRLDVQNINRHDVNITAFDVFEMDSRIQQGIPRYRMKQDAWGELVPSTDYFITEAPGVAPTTANTPVEFPQTIEPGEMQTYFITFVSQRPEKRYTRLFMRTNCMNFISPDTNNFLPGKAAEPEVEGLITLEFFGRGIGSQMAKDSDGDLSGLTLTFDPVKVGQSIEGETTLHNTGECDLRINQDNLRFATGDVEEFEFIGVFNGTAITDGDYIIPPGDSATIKARFTPSRSGSRRASVMLQSNDSTIFTDGISERGVYYLNFYGVGVADLLARDVRLAPAVIDGPGSHGVVHVVNTSTEVIDITKLLLMGPNVDEIGEDPSNPWPALPVRLDPETSVDLGIVLNPTSGSDPGPREATLEITYSGGEVIRVGIGGEAGSRTLMASPKSLFDDARVPVGSIARRTAIIVNTGTLPVSLSDIRIEGMNRSDYSFILPDRVRVAVGGYEFIEITYAPGARGGSEAKFVIISNATNGDQEVILSGIATGTHSVGDPNGSSITWGGNEGLFGASRRADASSRLSLGGSVPNPSGGVVEISFTLPREGMVEMHLYNASGHLVGPILSEERKAGVQTVTVNTSDLPSGIYMYTLRQNGELLSGSMTIVK